MKKRLLSKIELPKPDMTGTWKSPEILTPLSRTTLTRRSFLRGSLLSGLGLLFFSKANSAQSMGTNWVEGQKYGRVCFGKVSIRNKPHPDAEVTKDIFDDAMVPWLREVVGTSPGYGTRNWVETPDGYIYAARLQPSYHRPNEVLSEIPVHNGVKGMWAEVTVPYIDLQIVNPPVRTPSFKDKLFLRIYYSQVTWIDDLKVENGVTYYRTNQKIGSYGDMFWARADGFKPLTEEDISPIHPEAENKRITVDLTRQTLAAFEDNREVHFCRISTGAKFDYLGNAVDYWSTTPGPHPMYRKMVSLHMSGPTTGDWPDVPWSIMITGNGVAVHSTYWHNEFGIPRSHGCINCAPEDAKWVFRWSNPAVPYVPGDVDISSNWPPTGTIVDVIET